MTDSLFGNMDISNISDNPFEVAANTYWSNCTESYVKEHEKDGETVTNLIIKWMIDEPDNEYHGNTLTEFYKVFPGKDWNELDAAEKKSLKFLKRRLRRGFDLSEEEIAALKPSTLVGNGAFVTVVNNDGTGAHAGKVFTNVRDAVCQRIWVEEGNDSPSAGFKM